MIKWVFSEINHSYIGITGNTFYEIRPERSREEKLYTNIEQCKVLGWNIEILEYEE